MRFLAAALIAMSLGAAAPANADLGAADTGNKRTLSGKTHEAFCGSFEEDIDCNVVFEDGRLKVDGSEGIEESQVLEIVYYQKYVRNFSKAWSLFGSTKVVGLQCYHPGRQPNCHVFFDIKYSRPNEPGESWASIRFMNPTASGIFKSDLEAWTGEPLRAVGPNVKVVE